MITSPLHLLHINPTIRTRPRRAPNDRPNSRLLVPQAALIPVIVFLTCQSRVPGPLMDVAHLVATGVAQHKLLAEGVDLARGAAFAEAPAEIGNLLHCTAG